MAILQVEDIQKRFGRTRVLEDISFSLEQGQAMAIIGSIQDGIMGDPSMLFTKAVLDGVISIIFATVYGYGVMLSALSILVYQGAITLIAYFLGDYIPMVVVGQMSLVGSAVLMLIGFDLWDIKKFNVANLIPAAFMPILLYFFR